MADPSTYRPAPGTIPASPGVYRFRDARGRVVSDQGGARPDLLPVAAPPLYTNIDLDLQRYVANIFGDSLQGGAVAIEPRSGAVLALYSAPTPDANRFIGGIPVQYKGATIPPADERRAYK